MSDEMARVTQLDGSVTMVEMNGLVVQHCVDAEGVYLGLVEVAEGRTAVPCAPPDGDEWRWVQDGLAWRLGLTLASAKRLRWADLKDRRAELEFGLFEWDGSTFDGDPASQARIQGAVLLAIMAEAQGAAFEQQWTLADNSIRTLDATEMQLVGRALAAHVGEVHALARSLREALDACETLVDVELIGWP